MYAVIASPLFFKQIEDVISSKGEEVLFKSIDTDIDISVELEKISRISIKYLIIDITSLEDEKMLSSEIRKYRIKKESTQIVIIAPNYIPGNETLSLLVTMGVKDIIAPQGEEADFDISSLLNEVLDNPTPYYRAVRWDINNIKNIEDENISTEKTLFEKEIIYKEKLLSTYVIGIATAQRGAGSTYHSLSIANYLSSIGYKVAIVEITENPGLKYMDISVFKKQVDIFSFSNKNLETSQQKIINLCNDQLYNYIICDFGVIFNHEYLNEFLRANFKLLIAFGDMWHKESIDKIIHLPKIQTETFPMLINFSNTKNISKKAKHIYSSEYNNDIFNITENQKELYSKILQPILPKETKIKRNSIFRFKKSLL